MIEPLGIDAKIYIPFFSAFASPDLRAEIPHKFRCGRDDSDPELA
jgi:hypothetical protein